MMNDGDHRLKWTVAGALFVVASVLTAFMIDDGGFVSGCSALIAVVLLMVPLMAAVVDDLKARRTRMHELAVIAVAASCVQGNFQTSAFIALFMVISMIIETRAASGARTSLESLAKLAPGTATRITEDGREEDVDGRDLRLGDMIRVRPGENILADGIVVKGTSIADEANITGESIPADKEPNSAVFSGTINLTGVIDIRVERAGPDTVIGRVRQLILTAQESRLPFTRVVDQYFAYYTPLVIVAAATVLFFNRGESDGFDRVVALLVATCPIAIILAQPAAMVAALSSAARLGVLFKDARDIESMGRSDAFIFDKTGTLTTGALEVTRLTPCDTVETSELLAAAATAETGSIHPIAKAVQALAKKVNIDVVSPDELHEEPGRGVRAQINGALIVAGNLAWMKDNGLAAEQFSKMDEADSSGASLLFVASDGNALGWIGISDKPRAESDECLRALEAMGVRYIAVVSGDRQQVIEQVAHTLKIENFRSEYKPEQKVEFIEEVKAQGHHVVFVGDGVNDAPALAASHIGIAMGAAGSDVAIESAPVVLMNSDLNRLPFLVGLARRMKVTINQNFVVGVAIIVGGVTLSALGRLPPTVAAGMQVAGALFVAMNSARLIRQGEELQQ